MICKAYIIIFLNSTHQRILLLIFLEFKVYHKINHSCLLSRFENNYFHNCKKWVIRPSVCHYACIYDWVGVYLVVPTLFFPFEKIFSFVMNKCILSIMFWIYDDWLQLKEKIFAASGVTFFSLICKYQWKCKKDETVL